MDKNNVVIGVVIAVLVVAVGILGYMQFIYDPPSSTSTTVTSSIPALADNSVTRIAEIKKTGGDGSYYRHSGWTVEEGSTRPTNPFVDQTWSSTRHHYASRGRDLIGSTVAVTGTVPPIPTTTTTATLTSATTSTTSALPPRPTPVPTTRN